MSFHAADPKRNEEGRFYSCIFERHSCGAMHYPSSLVAIVYSDESEKQCASRACAVSSLLFDLSIPETEARNIEAQERRAAMAGKVSGKGLRPPFGAEEIPDVFATLHNIDKVILGHDKRIKALEGFYQRMSGVYRGNTGG